MPIKYFHRHAGQGMCEPVKTDDLDEAEALKRLGFRRELGRTLREHLRYHNLGSERPVRLSEVPTFGEWVEAERLDSVLAKFEQDRKE